MGCWARGWVSSCSVRLGRMTSMRWTSGHRRQLTLSSLMVRWHVGMCSMSRLRGYRATPGAAAQRLAQALRLCITALVPRLTTLPGALFGRYKDTLAAAQATRVRWQSDPDKAPRSDGKVISLKPRLAAIQRWSRRAVSRRDSLLSLGCRSPRRSPNSSIKNLVKNHYPLTLTLGY